MPKDTTNPYPDLSVTAQQREQLIELVNGCVQNHLQKYEKFFITDQHRVDSRRWEHVKSKDDLHVYSERTSKDQARKGLITIDPIEQTEQEKDMAVFMSVGTVVGELEDLMFGVINTTRDAMRIKNAYVGDFESGAILCPVVEPSEKEPFRSLTIKWMATESMLKSNKSRDYVCVEATDILHLENGVQIGYHVLHSIEFPQTKPLSYFTRSNMSLVGFYRHIHSTIIDTFGVCIIDPGHKAKRQVLTPVTATSMLTVTNYVRCGQLKKVAWMLQRQHAAFKQRQDSQNSKGCVMCGKSKNLAGLGRGTCKLCNGDVCFSCKVRERMHFIGQDDELIQRKITFCSQCMSKAINCSTQEAAQDQATGYHDSYDSASTFSESTLSAFSETSLIYH
ncbi:Zinc finger, RING/FYVE/PHD-type [Plasmopara halstedii]|uniref:Zinc finger, RING/FYVE/PHD-type n=1 Tax=Plasmopara halstedii TaxID=4781 RepID=A0A0P1AEW5_PLAHL|nr:Zinc finger, RING/FYVE/PHD-type [Plasmopara halstedii]CEG39532.1 Zinc finger, RING/FYVE/PHD-type [Plasmopara halstedii]|eukprot:XP_024575901.1 Zinc finger, RING/FYVE/PHD-type [Plasmopara halstedii]